MRTYILLAVGLVLLTRSAGAEEVLKWNQDGWKYWDSAKLEAKDWHAVDFDDQDWKDGTSPLGYGDDDIKTKISFGDDDAAKILTYHFRHAIELDDAVHLAGELIVDDGAVVFANGKEVYRINLPQGELKPTTTARIAKSGDAERYKHKFVIEKDKLTKGKNIIAIEVHQIGGTSSDLAVDLQLEAVAADAEFKKRKDAARQEAEAIENAIGSAEAGSQ
ncbi:MAG: hypothetical protein R3C28_19890 [Pirellulaceae bacterium]